jgi:hypothetical protein
VEAVENPADGVRIWGVPEIRGISAKNARFSVAGA